jgi:IS30 family transposase
MSKTLADLVARYRALSSGDKKTFQSKILGSNNDQDRIGLNELSENLGRSKSAVSRMIKREAIPTTTVSNRKYVRCTHARILEEVIRKRNRRRICKLLKSVRRTVKLASRELERADDSGLGQGRFSVQGGLLASMARAIEELEKK